MLATSWTPSRRPGLDVQAAPGRQVPQRPADDRRRRRLHASAARRSQERVQRAVDVHRRAHPVRGEDGRLAPPSRFISRRRTATSPTSSPPTTTTRSSCPRAPTSPSGRARSSGPARSSSRATPQNVGANFVANPSTGAARRYLASTSSASTAPAAADPRAPGRSGRRHRPVRRPGRASAAQQLQLQRSSSSSRPTTASCRCATTRRRSPMRASGRPSPCRSTGRGWSRRCSPGRRRRQRQPVRAGVPVDRHQRPPAHAGHHQGQAAAGGRRAPERVLDHADDREVPGDPGSWPRSSGQTGQGDRHQHQPQGRDPDQLLREGDVRQLRLAGRDDEPRRLRRPRRAERVPRRAADLERDLECRPLQELHLRLAGQAVHRPPSTCRPSSQIAGKIQTLLLQETPLVIPYFIDGLTATTSNVHGVIPTLDRRDLPQQGVQVTGAARRLGRRDGHRSSSNASGWR